MKLPLPDKEIELSDGQIGWHEVLLLVQVAETRLGSLLDDNLKDFSIKSLF